MLKAVIRHPFASLFIASSIAVAGAVSYQRALPPLKGPPPGGAARAASAGAEEAVSLPNPTDLRTRPESGVALLEAMPVQPPINTDLLGPMRITSGFGWRDDPFSLHTLTDLAGDRARSHHHAGIDIAVPPGTPVYAPGGGVVEDVGYGPGYGLFVVLTHPGTGYQSRLAHLSAFAPSLRFRQFLAFRREAAAALLRKLLYAPRLRQRRACSSRCASIALRMCGFFVSSLPME